ncbi:MAG: glycosyltransferase family 2 protein [bacterium]|nr:glycosyltransferase family 2 protein [bacterium]
MVISICIPHYNRAEYLLKVLDSIMEQTYTNIEVIISDDCSKDDSETKIPEYIKKVTESGTPIKFKYIRQIKNLGYDANLRASLEAGSGDYLFILGNDDGLNGLDAIQKLSDHIKQFDYPEVTFCNSMEYGVENSTHLRTNVTGVFGKGPETAIQLFRCFSFVAGIAYKKDAFKKYNTSKHDGSVYFQMYLSTKIISDGGTVAGIKDPLVTAAVKIGEQKANSYMDVLKERNKTIHEERGGLDRVFRVTLDGVKEHIQPDEINYFIRKIYSQLYFYTYPFWLYAYRKEGVYKASVNLALGCRPTSLVKNNLSFFNFFHSWIIFLIITIAGLIIPVSFVDNFKSFFKKLSKRTTYKIADAKQ